MVNKILIECDCHTHLLQVVYDEEDQEVYVSLFSLGKNGPRYSIFDKLRHIWEIIKTGNPYKDQICLNLDEINKLYEFLKQVQMENVK